MKTISIKYILLACLMPFLSGKLSAQFGVIELGYSPIAVHDNYTSFPLNQVFSIGVNKFSIDGHMRSLTLDYGSGKLLTTDNYVGLDLKPGYNSINEAAYNSQIIKLAYARYGFLIGGFDYRFSLFSYSGAHIMRETFKGSVDNPDYYTPESLKEFEKPEHYMFYSVFTGVGMQYNFVRQVGLRIQTDIGLGYVSGEDYADITTSLFPKISLCIKPDKLF